MIVGEALVGIGLRGKSNWDESNDVAEPHSATAHLCPIITQHCLLPLEARRRQESRNFSQS